jgi:hypothetical protein
VTVPSFGQSHAQDVQGGLTCDILLIDGGHTEECVFMDMMNFYNERLVRMRSCASYTCFWHPVSAVLLCCAFQGGLVFAGHHRLPR